MKNIIDPLTNKSYNLNTIEAKTLLKNYVSSYKLTGGSKINNIEPQTLLSLFGNKDVAIVNALSDNLHINMKNSNLDSNHGKDFISKKLKDYKIVIVYCANYSCSASETYAKKLQKQLKKDTIIYEYKGGIYEWSLLSLIYENFSVYDLEKSRPLNNKELVITLKNNNHWLKEKNNMLKDIKPHTEYQLNLDENNNSLLKDKVCVVTGATAGLGLETLKCMLRNGAKHVTGTYFNDKKRADKVSKELINEFGYNKVLIIQADARTELGNKKTFHQDFRSKLSIPKDCIPVDCVDINAGIFGPASYNNKHIHQIDINKYDQVMNLNLRGYVLGVQQFIRQAIYHKIPDAAIVCIKSIYGSGGSKFSNPAYQISKHGTMGLVRQTAIEFARPSEKLGIPNKIRINAVSPTFTTTALTKTMLSYNEVDEVIKNSNPSGKLADKNSIARTVCWLLSNHARDITGSDFPVDCGVLAEVIPPVSSIDDLNEQKQIEFLSCCGNTND